MLNKQAQVHIHIDRYSPEYLNEYTGIYASMYTDVHSVTKDT